MSEMERYRDMYFNDCIDLLKNKHSYRKHVDKFINYLKVIELDDRPRVIDKGVVEDCIGYYSLEKGELNTRSTMEAHLEALKSFYDYLSRTDKLPDIFTDYNYKEYKEAIWVNSVQKQRNAIIEQLKELKIPDERIVNYVYE